MDDYLTKPFTSQQLYQALLASAPAQPADSGNFDSARIEQLVQDIDRNSVVEMVGDFLNELPERITDVRRLHTGAHWPELKRAAHSFKGLLMLFGCASFAEKFQAIEEAADQKDAARIGELLEGLDTTAEATSDQLRDWLKNQKANADQ